MRFNKALKACLCVSITARKEKASKLTKKSKRETIKVWQLLPIKDLLANSFCYEVCLDVRSGTSAGVPPSIIHHSLFIFHSASGTRRCYLALNYSFSRATHRVANAKVSGTNSKSLIWLVGRALIHHSFFIQRLRRCCSRREPAKNRWLINSVD